MFMWLYTFSIPSRQESNVTGEQNPVTGEVLVDVWSSVEGFLVDDLRKDLRFPKHPSVSCGGTCCMHYTPELHTVCMVYRDTCYTDHLSHVTLLSHPVCQLNYTKAPLHKDHLS